MGSLGEGTGTGAQRVEGRWGGVVSLYGSVHFLTWPRDWVIKVTRLKGHHLTGLGTKAQGQGGTKRVGEGLPLATTPFTRNQRWLNPSFEPRSTWAARAEHHSGLAPEHAGGRSGSSGLSMAGVCPSCLLLDHRDQGCLGTRVRI